MVPYTETVSSAIQVCVPYTETVTQNYTVQVPYTENVTRQYTVQVPYTETVTQKYQVCVPYTEQVAQNYIVCVPYTETVTQNYTVQVPYTETMTQTYQVNVPYTEQVRSDLHCPGSCDDASRSELHGDGSKTEQRTATRMVCEPYQETRYRTVCRDAGSWQMQTRTVPVGGGSMGGGGNGRWRIGLVAEPAAAADVVPRLCRSLRNACASCCRSPCGGCGAGGVVVWRRYGRGRSLHQTVMTRVWVPNQVHGTGSLHRHVAASGSSDLHLQRYGKRS